MSTWENTTIFLPLCCALGALLAGCLDQVFGLFGGFTPLQGAWCVVAAVVWIFLCCVLRVTFGGTKR